MLMLETLQANTESMDIKTVRMTMEKKYILDGETLREYNETEYAQVTLDEIEAKRLSDERLLKEKQRFDLLAKLGITEEEVKLLLS